MLTCNILSINNLWYNIQKAVNHLPICAFLRSNIPPFTMRFSTFCNSRLFLPSHWWSLRNPESLNNKGEVRETTLIRRPMQKVVFGLQLGLWNEKRNNGSGKNQAGDATSEEPVEKVAELERRQVDGLWWRPIAEYLCLMRSLMKRGEPENGSPGCLAKSRMFRLFCFSLSHLLTFLPPHQCFTFLLFYLLPLNFFRLQNPESLICVLGNNIINNQKKNILWKSRTFWRRVIT